MPDFVSAPKPRYLVSKKGADGTARFYWQPSAALRAQGWPPRRLRHPDGRPVIDRWEAVKAAEALNSDLDRWRAGDSAPPRAAVKGGGVPFSGVYIIGQPAGPVKIGVSRDPRRRVSDLQPGNAMRLELLFYLGLPLEAARRFETTLHGRLAKHRRAGEWFNVTASEGARRAMALLRAENIWETAAA